MTTPEKPVLNVADVALTERGHGEHFSVKFARVGALLGLEGLGCALHVVPPGKRAFPFHRHHVADELFFIISGEGQYRFGDQTFPIRSGDLVTAPAGTKPHQIVNTGPVELHYLGLSTLTGVDVVDYPDSGKVAIAAGVKNADLKTATYVGVGRITPADYWDGENGS